MTENQTTEHDADCEISEKLSDVCTCGTALPVCSVCIQPAYCRGHEQCHYTKSWLRNPDGSVRDAGELI